MRPFAAAVLLVLLLLLAAAASGSEPSDEEATLRKSIGDALEFALYQEKAYRTVLEQVLSPEFPLREYCEPPSVAAREVDEAASVLAQALNRLYHWFDHRENLSALIASGRTPHAFVELGELDRALADVFVRTGTLREVEQKLFVQLAAVFAHHPSPILWFHLVLSTTIWSAVIAMVFLLFKSRALVILIGILLCLHASYVVYSELYVTHPNGDTFQIVKASINLAQSGSMSLATANQSLHNLRLHCNAAADFTDSVYEVVKSFNRRVNELASESSSDSLDGAHAIIESTRDTIGEHRASLERLSASRTGANLIKLQNLIKTVGLFDLLFSQMELAVFTNLKIGYTVNSYLTDHLKLLVGYAESGNLLQGITLLGGLYSQQELQHTKLKESVKFVSAANRAIADVRKEAAHVKPDIASEAWYLSLKATAAKYSFGSMAIPAAATVAAPALVAPAGLVAIAVTVMGYALSDGFAKGEKDAKELLAVISKLETVLSKTESRLSRHGRTLALLAEDVHGLMMNVNNSEIRFRAVRGAKLFTKNEIALLKDGVNRVLEDSAQLTKRYGDAINSIYSHLMLRPPSLPLELTAGSEAAKTCDSSQSCTLGTQK